MTKQPKWTPKPWKIGAFDQYLFGYDCICDGLTVGPAMLCSTDYGTKLGFRASSNIKSKMMLDANLIAAAPELYEALNSLLWDLEALMGESLGVYGLHLNGDASPWEEIAPGGTFERLDSIIEARAALSKARGGAQ